jgi:hypothetical protein
MMFVWGTRWYGTVDRCGRQFAATRFFHMWFLPVIPLGTMWVTEDHGIGYQGHAMRWSLKSIAAAYLRSSLLVLTGLIALIAVPAGAWWTLALPAVAGLGALGSLRWREARGDAARRAELLLSTLPTACDPLRMPRSLARSLHASVERDWAEVANGRTPGDLIERGDGTPAQVAAAFALLRMTARVGGPGAKVALVDSERLLTAQATAQLGTPYRDRDQPSS